MILNQEGYIRSMHLQFGTGEPFPHLIEDRVKHLKKMFIPLTYEALVLTSQKTHSMSITTTRLMKTIHDKPTKCTFYKPIF